MVDKKRIIAFAIVILLIVIVVRDRWIQQRPKSYAIGQINTSPYWPTDAGPEVAFIYYIGKEKYINTTGLPYKMEGRTYKGDCFIVTVPEGYPEKGQLWFKYKLKSCEGLEDGILWTKPQDVPDSILMKHWFGRYEF